MAYSPSWTNGDESGRVLAGEHFIDLADGEEMADALNRRRLMTYYSGQDFSSHLAAGKYVKASTVDSATPPPFTNFRTYITSLVLNPTPGALGGSPATPTAMDWLWPVSGGDEGKIIVADTPGTGEVNLFDKLNGTSDWTDATLTGGSTFVRAVHCNELRQSVEWIRRGRWELPIYSTHGLFSVLPDSTWAGGAVANNGTNELRATGWSVLWLDTRGIKNVDVRSSSKIEITASHSCSVEIRHCLRNLDCAGDPPTWNNYRYSGSAWATPGGKGSGDSTGIGTVGCSAGQPASLSGSSLASALQAMVDGAEQSFLFCRSDTGAETVTFSAKLFVEFDLSTPPN